MRVTNNMMTNNLLYNVNRNLQYMSEKQTQLATGSRIQSASDDPILAAKILSRTTDLAANAQYGRNVKDAQGWLEVTEKALEDNVTIFQRIRELTVQASSETNTPDDIQKIKLEVEQLRNQLITNANTTYAGRYVFSGFETNKPLLNKDGTYNIDVNQYSIENRPKVQFEVSVGENMDVMTSGLDIYGIVDETNVMNTTFPGGGMPASVATATGTASSKSKAVAPFDITQDNTGNNLDITIGGVNYVVDETTFDGSINALDKETVINTIKNAPGGGGTLGDVAEVYFDKDDNLVIESKTYGNVGMAPTVPANYSSITTGSSKVEASVAGVAAMPNPLSAADIAVLKDRGVDIVVNGQSHTVKVDPGATFTTPAGYAAALQTAADTAFGPGNVSITAPGDVITFETVGTVDGVEPEITVDFVRTEESELISDIDELINFMDTGNYAGIDGMLSTIDTHLNNVLQLRADIGARTNRIEMIIKKIDENEISYTKLLSEAADADMSEVIMLLKNAENVYKASLSVGGRVIQPSLVDFIR